MSAPINVLAVMDRAAESAGMIVKESNGDFRAVIYQDDLFKARAAIAELIEAADRVWSKGGAVPGSDWDDLGNALAAVSPK